MAGAAWVVGLGGFFALIYCLETIRRPPEAEPTEPGTIEEPVRCVHMGVWDRSDACHVCLAEVVEVSDLIGE